MGQVVRLGQIPGMYYPSYSGQTQSRIYPGWPVSTLPPMDFPAPPPKPPPIKVTLPPMKLPPAPPFELPSEALPPAPGSFAAWLEEEMIGGVKNMYLAIGGGGLILLLALARPRRR